MTLDKVNLSPDRVQDRVNMALQGRVNLVQNELSGTKLAPLLGLITCIPKSGLKFSTRKC